MRKSDDFNPGLDPQTAYPPDMIQTYDESRARPGNPYVAMVMKGYVLYYLM